MEKTKEKYSIILDTNIIWVNDDKYAKLFNTQFFDLIDFVKNHKAIKDFDICIPKVVLDERIYQRVDQIKPRLEKIDEAKKLLGEFAEIKIKKKENPEKILDKKAKEIIKKHNIKILDYPNVNQKEIIKEACSKKPPFFNGGKQEYKDKIIWETIKEHSKNSKSNCIFLTNNSSDFDESILKPEFQTISKKEFKIFQDIGSLKLDLDEKFDLKLDLDALYERKRKEIKGNLNRVLYNISGEKESYSWNGKETFIASILIEDFNIENISENAIYADIEIKGKAKFFEREKEEDEYGINLISRDYTIPTEQYVKPVRSYVSSLFRKSFEEKEVTIKIKINLNDYSIMNFSIREGSYLYPWTRGYY
jgi:hypothetical protein